MISSNGFSSTLVSGSSSVIASSLVSVSIIGSTSSILKSNDRFLFEVSFFFSFTGVFSTSKLLESLTITAFLLVKDSFLVLFVFLFSDLFDVLDRKILYAF